LEHGDLYSANKISGLTGGSVFNFTQISENTSTVVVISLRLTDEGVTTLKLVSG